MNPFSTGTGEWLCTDIGSPGIVPIQLNRMIRARTTIDLYAVDETVFDEYDFGGYYRFARR
jgi:hypothetical protein